MEKETYMPQDYKRIDKITFEDCYFFYAVDRDVWDNLGKLIDNWKKEDKEKNKE